jgi:Tol biopolymer transport system component
LIIVLVAVAACTGTFDLQIETTPGPEATITALESENAELATQVATGSSTPTPPDLGALAYVQGGDVWVRSFPDGERRRLTTDGRNRAPRWSPTGEWLAFRKGEHDQVWIIWTEGEDAYAINEGIPVEAYAWSPGEDRLAYVDAPNGELRVQSAGAPHPRVLVQDTWENPATPPPQQQRSVLEIAWSPDGTRIAYTLLEHSRQPDEASGPPSYQGLWVVPVEGGEPKELYVSGVPQRGAVRLFGWTADGAYLLFWQGEILSASMLADGVPLYALPVDGGEPLQLTEAVLPHADFITPAPTGSRVAVVAGESRITWNNKRLAVVQPGRGDFTYLTVENVAALSTTWSPDGTRLAYAAGPTVEDWGGGPARGAMMARDLWLIDVDGTEPRQLTDDPSYRDERPLWSADGSHILFARLDSEDRASLWLVPVAGGDAEQVVEELTPAPEWFGFYGHIAWREYFDWWRGGVQSTIADAADPAPPTAATQPPDPASASPGASTTPTPFTGTDVVLDCAAVYPGMPGCLRNTPLVDGRLAFVDERSPFDGVPTMLDLASGEHHELGKRPNGLRGWSPSGAYLLTDTGVYNKNGELAFPIDEPGACLRPFWAPPSAVTTQGEALICQTDRGGLVAYGFNGTESRELLPPGTLGAEGRDTVLLSTEGILAWSPSGVGLAETDEWSQELHARTASTDADPTSHLLSSDIRETYFELIDWGPGTRLILAGRGMLSTSVWVDGVPLVTIHADTGDITELGVTMLLTPEAYAWHPTRPGLLALAAGSNRFINANKRMVLLDVVTGTITYVTGEEEATFTPSWSPDGEQIAYAAVRRSPQAVGDGDAMEQTLQGRAIYVFDYQTGDRRPLTEPGAAIDAWPQWTTDGQDIIYVRKHAGKMDVRVVALDGSRDDLLLTGLPERTCVYGGCRWDRILAYSPAPPTTEDAGDDEGVAAQGHTALRDLEDYIRDHIQNDRPGTLRYPMTTEGVLCCEPGTSEAGHPDGRWPRVGGADNRWVDIDPQ